MRVLLYVLVMVGLSSSLVAENSAIDEARFAHLYSLVHPEDPSSPVVGGDPLERELAEQAQRTRQVELTAYRDTLTIEDVTELVTYLESPAAARHPLDKRQMLVMARIQKRAFELIKQRQSKMRDASTATAVALDAHIEQMRRNTESLKRETELRDEKIRALQASLKAKAEQHEDGKTP